MQNSTTLKPNISLFTFYIFLIVIIIGNAILNLNNREAFNTVFVVLYIIAGLMALNSWLKTRNIYSLNFMLFCMLGILFFGGFLEGKLLKLFFAILMLIVLIFHFSLLVKGRNQWRSRKILDLAARPVNDTADGFTSRPYPAGEIKFSKEQIRDFAKFMKNNTIAFPYFEKDKVSFVLLDFDYRSYLPFKTNISKMTYVTFDYSGKVSVNIAKMDYQKYKEELTFDQLCESLGNLFKTFLSLYQEDKEKVILDRITG